MMEANDTNQRRKTACMCHVVDSQKIVDAAVEKLSMMGRNQKWG